jgi:predicted O-methyltransferase YrrM
MNLIKIIFSLWIGISCTLYAEWEPECCFDEGISIEPLKDVLFLDLKGRITKTLERSWCSPEKINLLMDLILIARPEVSVEIGVFTGSSTLPVATVLKYLNHGKIYCIDAWSNAEAIKNMDFDDPNRLWWSEVNMADICDTFQRMLREHNLQQICIALRKPSEEAVHDIGEIDFLHLDGDLSEKGSLLDVALYLPKVKKGGYILLSNLFHMVKGKAPKMKSFAKLFDACEMICGIERDHAVLFRKN